MILHIGVPLYRGTRTAPSPQIPTKLLLASLPWKEVVSQTPSFLLDSQIVPSTAAPIMSTSRSPTPPSNKRLLQELKSIVHDPSPILEILRPASEAEILHWEAVMKGVPGTAYEGISPPCLHPTYNPHPPIPSLTQFRLSLFKPVSGASTSSFRPPTLSPRPKSPSQLPSATPTWISRPAKSASIF